MDSRVKILTFKLDVIGLGWNFWLPLLVLFGLTVDLYFFRGGLQGLMIFSDIQQVLGIWAIPLVSFMIIGMFQDLVETNGKEMLLSLPYSDLKHGVFRVLRMTFFYMVCFSASLGILAINCSNGTVSWWLPFVQILHFVSLAFAVIILTKSVMISYGIIGLYASLEYTTRGGFTGWLYPFEWSVPKPGANSNVVFWTLLAISICLLLLGQWRFSNRERLVR